MEDKKFANISKSKAAKDEIEKVAEKEENEVIYRDDDDDEDLPGCCSWFCQWFSPKGIFRRNTVKLAHRLKKRRSRKSFNEEEIVVEDRNDLSAATIAALSGR